MFKLNIDTITTLLSSTSETSTKEPGPVDITMAIMTLIGAVFLLWFSLPLFIDTLRTKDTSNQGYLMWSFYLCSSIFLLVPGLVNPISAFVNGDVTNMQKVSMILLLIIGIINIITLITGLTILILKSINRSKAKKAGLTECEYCILHNPILKKDSKKVINDDSNNQVN